MAAYPERFGPPGGLGGDDLARTADAIAAVQEPDGAIPWRPGGHTDAWNHLECAMALDLGGRSDAADRAWDWLVGKQRADGSWAMRYEDGEIVDASGDSNQSAYIAVATWHRWMHCGDRGFVEAMWPVVRKALNYVVGLRSPVGHIWWARDPTGKPNTDALLTGNSSTLMSLRCGLALAALMGEEQPGWEVTAGGVRHAVAALPKAFLPRGRWSMDWYYPVLGGALCGAPARRRLREGWSEFVVEDLGVRCVSDEPWVTGAETCELVIALHLCGLTTAAHRLLRDIQFLRHADGGYWTGWQHAAGAFWPDEQTTWTGAAVILAADALSGGVTDAVFRGTHLPAGAGVPAGADLLAGADPPVPADVPAGELAAHPEVPAARDHAFTRPVRAPR
jgi:hypothetical protein